MRVFEWKIFFSINHLRLSIYFHIFCQKPWDSHTLCTVAHSMYWTKFTSNLLKRLFLTFEWCQVTLRQVQRSLLIARIYFWCSKESNRHLCILLSRSNRSFYSKFYHREKFEYFSLLSKKIVIFSLKFQFFNIWAWFSVTPMCGVFSFKLANHTWFYMNTLYSWKTTEPNIQIIRKITSHFFFEFPVGKLVIVRLNLHLNWVILTILD